MKKKSAIFITAIFVMGLMPVTAFAHGHGGSVTTTARYSLCSVKNCNTVGNHWHNGTVYTGHSFGDGHDYHQLCDVQDCISSYVHQHDEASWFPHSYADGHDYHGVCSVQGCTETNLHLHDGTACFPHSNGDGHSYHNSHNGGSRHH